MSSPRTKLENLLFWWLLICCAVAILFIVMLIVLPSSIADFSIVGPSSLPTPVKMAIGLTIGAATIALFFYYTWLMRNPSRKILAIGMFLYLWASIRAEWPDGLVSLSIAPPVRITLIDNPSFLLQINIVSILISSMFGIAWYLRSHQAEQTTVQEPSVLTNDCELEWVCEHCDAPVREDEKFCSHCGKDVSTKTE